MSIVYKLQQRSRSERDPYDYASDFSPKSNFETIQTFTNRQDAETIFNALNSGWGSYDYQLTAEAYDEDRFSHSNWSCTYYVNSKSKELLLVSKDVGTFLDYRDISPRCLIWVEDSPEKALAACNQWLADNPL